MTRVGTDAEESGSPRSEPIDRSGRGTTRGRTNDGLAVWGELATLLRQGAGTSWLSVCKHGGGVHTRPFFAAWDESSFVFATKDSAAKTTHLRENPAVSVAVDLGTVHLVAEGVATRLTRPADLRRASAAMHDVHDWPTEVVGEQLDAPYAAPTSGGPPFEAWELAPRRVHAFPTEDQFEPTRFVFTGGIA